MIFHSHRVSQQSFFHQNFKSPTSCSASNPNFTSILGKILQLLGFNIRIIQFPQSNVGEQRDIMEEVEDRSLKEPLGLERTEDEFSK